MKKLMCVFLFFAVLLASCSMASCDNYVIPTYGRYYPTGTILYSKGQTDEYSFWTGDDTQKAALGVFLYYDLMREDYAAYNACLPVQGLFCVLSDARNPNVIMVLYECNDGYLSLEYNLNSASVTYNIFFTYDKDGMKSFRKFADGYRSSFKSCFYSYYDYGFNDPVPEYGEGHAKWYEFKQQHPDMYDFSEHIGW